MSRQIVDAVYQHGAFHLVGAPLLNIEEGKRVQLVINDTNANSSRVNVLELAAQVYAGLSDEAILDIEQIAADRSGFFVEGE